MTDTVNAILAEEIARIAPEIALEDVAPDEDLREALDIDSMDFLTLVSALSRRLDISIDETEYRNFATLGRATAFLASKAGAP